MKKYILALMICLLLVGCRSKNSLVCKSSEEVSGNTYKTEIKFKYKNNIVKKAILTMDVELGDNAFKNYNIYYNAFEQTYSGLKDLDGIKVEIKKNDKGYQAIVNVDYEVFNDKIDMINSSLNKEQTKTYYENLKYECK